MYIWRSNFTSNLQQYESSSESDEEIEMDQQIIQEKTTVRRKFDWVKYKNFSDDVEAQIAIKQEEQWSRHYTNKGQDGIKVHYQCNEVKFRGKESNATIYLYYPDESDKVIFSFLKN